MPEARVPEAVDRKLFRICMLSALGIAVVVSVAALAALVNGASTHAVGLVTSGCRAALQVVGGASGLTLLALPAMLAVSVAVHALVVVYRTRRVVGTLLQQAIPNTERLHRVATRAGVAAQVDLVYSAQPLAFVYGLRHPRVLITSEVLARLDDQELEAVLHHEAHHVDRRDPRRLTLMHAVGRALFMFPVVADCARQVAVATELAADRRAIERVGRIQLASALSGFLRGPAIAGAPSAALDGHEKLRLAQLQDPAGFQFSVRLRRSSATLSALMLTALALLLTALLTVPAMAMP